MILCVSPVLRYFLSLNGVIIYSNPLCRLGGLMAGGLLALLVRTSGFKGAKFVMCAWFTLIAASALAVCPDRSDARWTFIYL